MVQFAWHLAMLVASGLSAMDEHWGVMCELTAGWPAQSPANQRSWDCMGDLALRCLLRDLPLIQTKVRMAQAIYVRMHS